MYNIIYSLITVLNEKTVAEKLRNTQGCHNFPKKIFVYLKSKNYIFQ